MRAVASTWALVWSISCPGKSMSGQVCSVGAETACACGLVDRAVGRMENGVTRVWECGHGQEVGQAGPAVSPRDPPPGRRLRSGERST